MKPHEETVDSAAASLTSAILAEGIVRDPIIVDRDEYVILDGMHRFNSLKILKCRFAPCCLVDYDSPEIKVSSWFRTSIVQDAEFAAEKLLIETQLEFSKRKIKLDESNCNPQVVIMTDNDTQFSLPSISDPIERGRIAVRLEKALIRKGISVEYASETVALQSLKSSNVNVVILLPNFTKSQIREFAKRHLLLPHKTTRHVMPSRPLRLDIPLPFLMSKGVSQTEADKRLLKLLNKRRVDRKAPGSIVDGRRYEEELLVFTA